MVRAHKLIPMSSGSLATLLDNPITTRVVELAALNSKRVSACPGKHLIILFGREQVGKSTTINALLGTKFMRDPQNERYVKPLPGQPEHADMGTAEKLGRQCTVFPAAYEVPGHPDCLLLDTQGFLGERKDPEEVTAASILLDAAIQVAASVRIVYVEDSTFFYGGNTNITPMAQLINRIICSDDIDMYCLLTKFQPSYSLFANGFLHWTAEQKNEAAKREAFKAAKAIVDAQKERQNEMIDRYALMTRNKADYESLKATCEKANTEPDSMTEDEVETVKKAAVDAMESIQKTAAPDFGKYLRFANVIERSFQKGLYGCIFPEVEGSAPMILEMLFKTSPIEKDSLNFRSCTKERSDFNEGFEKSIQDEIIPFLAQIGFSYKYPPHVIESLKARQEAELSRHRNNKEAAAKATTPELQQEYELVQSDAIASFESELEDLITKEKESTAAIDEIKNSPPVRVRIIPFAEDSNSFLLWRNATVTYDLDVGYVKVIEELSPGVKRSDTNGFNISKFVETRTAADESTFVLKDPTHPEHVFEVVYSSASGWEKAGLLGIRGLSFFAELAAAYFSLGTDSTVAMSLVETAAMKMMQRNCRGRVQFYARREDREQAALGAEQNRLQLLKEAQKKKQMEIDEVKKQAHDKLETQIDQAIDRVVANLAKLATIDSTVSENLRKWREPINESGFKSEMERFLGYWTVANMLYSADQSNQTICRLRHDSIELQALGGFDDDDTKLSQRSPDSVTVTEVLHQYDLLQ